jgi:two-component system NtrC family sensor kinase
MEIRRPAVLIVDDEENILRSLRRLLRHEPFDTIATTDPYEALSCLRMPDIDGDHLIARVKALDARIVCIRLTGYPDPRAPEPPREAVFRTIEKPWEDEAITGAVHDALELYRRTAAAAPAQAPEPAPTDS